MRNELVVKYITFHSVLKELIVTYSINSKTNDYKLFRMGYPTYDRIK